MGPVHSQDDCAGRLGRLFRPRSTTSAAAAQRTGRAGGADRQFLGRLAYRAVDGRGQKGGGMYNGMIAPVKPFAIRGVIWYQGETNVEQSGLKYYDKTRP